MPKPKFKTAEERFIVTSEIEGSDDFDDISLANSKKEIKTLFEIVNWGLEEFFRDQRANRTFSDLGNSYKNTDENAQSYVTIEKFLSQHRYFLSYKESYEIKNNKCYLYWTFTTNLTGNRLAFIKESILQHFKPCPGYDSYTRSLGIDIVGWENISEVCDHVNNNRLQILPDSNGGFSEILECCNCKELFHRPITKL